MKACRDHSKVIVVLVGVVSVGVVSPLESSLSSFFPFSVYLSCSRALRAPILLFFPARAARAGRALRAHTQPGGLRPPFGGPEAILLSFRIFTIIKNNKKSAVLLNARVYIFCHFVCFLFMIASR